MLQLSYTAHDLAPFARDLGFDGPPFVWDAEETSATADTPLAYTGVLDRELGDVEAEFATLRDGDLANAARKAKGLPGIELPEHAPMAWRYSGDPDTRPAERD